MDTSDNTYTASVKAINPDLEHLARHLFAMYNSVDAQTFDGRPVPTWEEIAAREGTGPDCYAPKGTRAKWYKVASMFAVLLEGAPWPDDIKAKVLDSATYLFGGCENETTRYLRYAP